MEIAGPIIDAIFADLDEDFQLSRPAVIISTKVLIHYNIISAVPNKELYLKVQKYLQVNAKPLRIKEVNDIYLDISGRTVHKQQIVLSCIPDFERYLKTSLGRSST